MKSLGKNCKKRLANEVASKKEMEKTNRLAENLKEINDKLTKSKSQKENEIESVKQVVEDAEWDVEDAETHVDELKIEAVVVNNNTGRT